MATDSSTTWDIVVDHTDLVVAFGGLPLKNTAMMPGGATRHPTATTSQYRARSGWLVSTSPLARRNHRDRRPARRSAPLDCACARL